MHKSISIIEDSILFLLIKIGLVRHQYIHAKHFLPTKACFLYLLIYESIRISVRFVAILKRICIKNSNVN